MWHKCIYNIPYIGKGILPNYWKEEKLTVCCSMDEHRESYAKWEKNPQNQLLYDFTDTRNLKC